MLLTYVTVFFAALCIGALFGFAWLMDRKFTLAIALILFVGTLTNTCTAYGSTITSTTTIAGITYRTTITGDLSDSASETHRVPPVGNINGAWVVFLESTFPGENSYPIHLGCVVYDSNGDPARICHYDQTVSGYKMVDMNGFVAYGNTGVSNANALRRLLDTRCRGNSGDLKDTQLACKMRDAL